MNDTVSKMRKDRRLRRLEAEWFVYSIYISFTSFRYTRYSMKTTTYNTFTSFGYVRSPFVVSHSQNGLHDLFSIPMARYKGHGSTLQAEDYLFDQLWRTSWSLSLGSHGKQ